MINTEVPFIEEPEDNGPEPLRMEHFHLPLGLWFVGILISLLGFIAEIIIHRRRPKLSVSQITPEPENLGEREGAELDLAGTGNIEDIEDTEV